MIVPEGYQKLRSLPEDPEGSITYGKRTEGSECVLTIFLINPADAMDFDGKEDLIAGIHQALAGNQALIEVDNGKIMSGKPYIYSIIKTQTDNGMQYFLLMHIKWQNAVLAVRAFFDECGITGMRDTTIYAMCCKENPDLTMDDWFCDPYDKELKADFKMNLSEQAKYDELFPMHPLTECRQIVKFYKENF